MNESDRVVGLAENVGGLLRARNMVCATAESCTGGLIAHLITEVAGCSAYFAGGAVVYSYAAKEQVLGVDGDLLARDGAVSYSVAQQMAQGARSVFNADVAVSTTGIAGPDGGLPGKPVGTVHIHLSAADGTERGVLHVWNAGRSENKLLSAEAALHMLLAYLEGLP